MFAPGSIQPQPGKGKGRRHVTSGTSFLQRQDASDGNKVENWLRAQNEHDAGVDGHNEAEALPSPASESSLKLCARNGGEHVTQPNAPPMLQALDLNAGCSTSAQTSLTIRPRPLPRQLAHQGRAATHRHRKRKERRALPRASNPAVATGTAANTHPDTAPDHGRQLRTTSYCGNRDMDVGSNSGGEGVLRLKRASSSSRPVAKKPRPEQEQDEDQTENGKETQASDEPTPGEVAAALDHARAAGQCHFFLAAPEIRDAVYRYLLVAPSSVKVLRRWTQVYQRCRTGIEIAIMLVNRQAAREGARVLYSENQFLYLLRDADCPMSGLRLGDRVIHVAKYGYLFRKVEVVLEANRGDRDKMRVMAAALRALIPGEDECTVKLAAVNGEGMEGSGGGGDGSGEDDRGTKNSRKSSKGKDISRNINADANDKIPLATDTALATTDESTREIHLHTLTLTVSPRLRQTSETPDPGYPYPHWQFPPLQPQAPHPDAASPPPTRLTVVDFFEPCSSVSRALRKLDMDFLCINMHTPSGRFLEMTLDLRFLPRGAGGGDGDDNDNDSGSGDNKGKQLSPLETSHLAEGSGQASYDVVTAHRETSQATRAHQGLTRLRAHIIAACTDEDAAVRSGWWEEHGAAKARRARERAVRDRNLGDIIYKGGGAQNGAKDADDGERKRERRIRVLRISFRRVDGLLVAFRE